jgi:hypothetical protein
MKKSILFFAQRYYYALLFIGLLSCKDAFEDEVAANVITHDAIDIQRHGVTLRGEITDVGNKGIKDHGFIVAINKDPKISIGSKVSLGSPNGVGEFQYTLDTLNSSEKYYYRSYLTDDENPLQYGELKFFFIEYMQISKITPSVGTRGTVVKISGAHFISDISQIEVKFGDKVATVLTASETEISTVVPDNARGISTISVKAGKQWKESYHGFTVYPPLPSGFFPAAVPAGDTLTITGKYFYQIANVNQVQVRFKSLEEPLLGAITQSAVKVTDTTIKVIVPKMDFFNPSIGDFSKYKISVVMESRVNELQDVFIKAYGFSLDQTTGKAGDMATFVVDCRSFPEHLTLDFGNNITVKPFADYSLDLFTRRHTYIIPSGIPAGIKVKVTLKISNASLPCFPITGKNEFTIAP